MVYYNWWAERDSNPHYTDFPKLNLRKIFSLQEDFIISLLTLPDWSTGPILLRVLKKLLHHLIPQRSYDILNLYQPYRLQKLKL